LWKTNRRIPSRKEVCQKRGGVGRLFARRNHRNKFKTILNKKRTQPKRGREKKERAELGERGTFEWGELRGKANPKNALREIIQTLGIPNELETLWGKVSTKREGEEGRSVRKNPKKQKKRQGFDRN